MRSASHATLRATPKPPAATMRLRWLLLWLLLQFACGATTSQRVVVGASQPASETMIISGAASAPILDNAQSDELGFDGADFTDSLVSAEEVASGSAPSSGEASTPATSPSDTISLDDLSSLQLNATKLPSNGTSDDDAGQVMKYYAILSANAFIFVVGFIGNLIVILVILRFTRAETVTDIYILNLAVADLMFLTGLIFLNTTMMIDNWIFGYLVCKLYMSLTSLNQFASSLLLVVMSFDRYIAVCHPIYAQRFRQTRGAKIICACIWVICVILMSPIFLFAKIHTDSKTEVISCSISWPETKVLGFSCEWAFTFYSFALGFALPLLLIACFYVQVIRRLRTAAAARPVALGSSRRSRSREETNRHIEHLVVAIILTYTLCWLPYWVTQIIISVLPVQSSYAFQEVALVSSCVSYINSALNPILYAFLSDNFKRRCSDILQSIYKLSWCIDRAASESHPTGATASGGGDSEVGRREFRSQAPVLLNESVRFPPDGSAPTVKAADANRLERANFNFNDKKQTGTNQHEATGDPPTSTTSASDAQQPNARLHHLYLRAGAESQVDDSGGGCRRERRRSVAFSATVLQGGLGEAGDNHKGGCSGGDKCEEV